MLTPNTHVHVHVYTMQRMCMYTVFIRYTLHTCTVISAVAEEGGCLLWKGSVVSLYICMYFITTPQCAWVAQWVEHLQWHAGGRGFESHPGHLFFLIYINAFVSVTCFFG